jgi:hypothetical protein
LVNFLLKLLHVIMLGGIELTMAPKPSQPSAGQMGCFGHQITYTLIVGPNAGLDAGAS